MTICKTGDCCPRSGQWLQEETGEISWTEKGDVFAPYYKKTGGTIMGAPLYNVAVSNRAHYKFVEPKTD